MVATAYQPQTETRNYLHLAVTATELKAGDNLPVNFNVKGDNLQLLNQIKDFTYIVSPADLGRVEIQGSRLPSPLNCRLTVWKVHQQWKTLSGLKTLD